MKTKQINKEDLNHLVEILSEGGLVAIPTDTVYGLAASSLEEKNYHHLIKAKGRPENKPFPLQVSSYEMIEGLCDLSDRDRHLMKTFMPGAITFIFKKKTESFPFLKHDTLGIRMASDSWVWNIIDLLGKPIWLPSANRSGEPTALNSNMVLEQLDGLIEAVVLGETHVQESSTVIDLSSTEIKCLRAGKISLETIEKEIENYENSNIM